MNTSDILQLAGSVGAGINAGIFFAFSTFVMRALARLTPQEGVLAMQEINKTVITPLFMLAFMGTAVISGVEIVRFTILPESRNIAALSAALLYAIGTFGVTIRFNVPLNNKLAACDPASPATDPIWQNYLIIWTRWNHVRTLAAILALAAWVLS